MDSNRCDRRENKKATVWPLVMRDRETARGSGCSESALCRYQTDVKFRLRCSRERGNPPMQTHDIDYRDETVNLRGYLAFDEKIAERRPGVLVFHEGLGLGDFAMARARMLAELGYVALAADMFGERRQARNLQEVAKLVGDLRNQPETLRARGRAALTTLAARPRARSVSGWLRRSPTSLATSCRLRACRRSPNISAASAT